MDSSCLHVHDISAPKGALSSMEAPQVLGIGPTGAHRAGAHRDRTGRPVPPGDPGHASEATRRAVPGATPSAG